MLEILIDDPLLVLFIVSAIGYAIGRIKIRGASLGVAAVLFVGLAFGALSPDLKPPTIIFEIGLVIFVYSVGLTSGPGFFASFKRKGLRDNLLVLAILLLVGIIAAVAGLALSLPATVTAGLYAGSLTNTPALASLLDLIGNSASPDLVDAMLDEPVIGYSVAYPMGVLGVILVILILQRVFKIDYKADEKRLQGIYLVEQELYNQTALVTRQEVTWADVAQLARAYDWNVVFTRLQRAGEFMLVTGETRFQIGDRVSLVGTPEGVQTVTSQMGESTSEHLEFDRSRYDFRRIFVSNSDIAGKRLAELNLPHEYGAVVTRVRRGDIDLLAQPNTVLELGDRVRVVARREEMPRLSALFGDSYKALSEIDLMTFGLGISLGLLLGLVTLPLPGGAFFRIGNAIGPLVVGLVLGYLRRTGPIVWTLPYSANLTLRQIGLILLLASIGLRSGYTFFQTLGSGGGLSLFIAGAIVTCTASFLTLWIGYKLLKIPFSLLIGMLAGLHTQPAVLGFSLEQSNSELPNTGYALSFPIATVTKILVTQMLLVLLR